MVVEVGGVVVAPKVVEETDAEAGSGLSVWSSGLPSEVLSFLGLGTPATGPTAACPGGSRSLPVEQASHRDTRDDRHHSSGRRCAMSSWA